MPSGSFLEQLTNNGSLSPVVMGTTAIVVIVLTYLIASRFLFSSKSKSKSSKQQTTKSKETTNKKQQQSNESSTGKKKNKGKKNATAAASASTAKATAVSSSSTSSQSEESEEEEKVLPPPPPPTKKTPTPAKKATTPTEENPKTNGVKATGNEQVEQGQNADAKKKRAKGTTAAPVASAPAAPTKTQGTTGKNAQTNANSSAKKVTVPDVEPGKDDENVVDQDDEGQWVTQGGKQVNNRNRNKGKNETNHSQDSTNVVSPVAPTTSERKSAGAEKRSTGPTTTTKSSEDKNDVQVESTPTVASTPAAPEPIEICQLLPSKENPYTASDDWWKRALNKPQTFSVDDIGEWPEREQDEQYVVNVKRIIPTRNPKNALTEKDINVANDVHDDVNQHQNGNSQKRLDDSTNNNVNQTKKKTNNVRRVS